MIIDLSEYRHILMSNAFEEISIDLKKFDNKECYFYYDESNNPRKLWLTEDGFNAPIDSDFVLGGVMHFGRSSSADVVSLKSVLCLQKSINEIKFKHISKSKDFIGCLTEWRVRLFLKWLYQSDLYVHYSNISNLYWTIIDIIDSIDERMYISFGFQIKNELYKIACLYKNDFYQFLAEFNYPNIAKDNIRPFCQGLINFIDTIPEELSFELELLRQGLKSACKQNELVFLQDNDEKMIIESFFPFYLRPIGVFSSAKHVFDNEYLIEEQFEKYELFDMGKCVNNYCFVDSKDNLFVQVSDCIIGLLGKYYTYINNITINDAEQLFESITAEQKSTLKLLSQVIIKSENYSKLLFNSVESTEERNICAYILENALL